MPRTPRIKWTRSQVGRLSAAVRAYNAAIEKAIAANPSRADYFPERVTYQQMKAQITSARQLRNVVNRLNRAKRPGAFELVKQGTGELVSRYERNEARIIQSVRERAKAQQRKRMGLENEAGILTGNMGTLQAANLRPTSTRVPDMSVHQIRRAIELANRTAPKTKADRAFAMYENYVRALDTEGFDIYNPQFYRELVEQIRFWAEREPDFLVWAYEAHDERLVIDFVYDSFQQMESRVEYIRQGWADARAEWEANHE